MPKSNAGLKVLIVTGEGDTHANAVAWALRRRGHRPVLWFLTEFPDRQHVTATVMADGQSSIRLPDGDRHVELCDADVIWMRRYAKPRAPAQAHAADRQVIEVESDAFLRGLLEMLPRDAFWVNPLHEGIRASFKPVQLAAAVQVGLDVPDTCFSNDPAAVRAFCERHRSDDREVILKTFRQQYWRGKDGAALVLPTTPVRDEIFLDASSIAWCPAIYQPRLRKAFEVRATVMGDEVLSLRLNSQERGETADDWRVLYDFPISMSPMELPADTKRKSLALMRKLGIVFGCIDFVVTPEGQYIFLEVNEMGQFLWVEQACPAVPLLDTFTQFLVRRDVAFQREAPVSGDVSYEGYVADDECRMQLLQQRAKRKEHPPEPRVMEA